MFMYSFYVECHWLSTDCNNQLVIGHLEFIWLIRQPFTGNCLAIHLHAQIEEKLKSVVKAGLDSAFNFFKRRKITDTNLMFISVDSGTVGKEKVRPWCSC
jgi:hypothetical protein